MVQGWEESDPEVDLHARRARFAALLRRTERALSAGEGRGALKKLKRAAAELEACERAGRVTEVVGGEDRQVTAVWAVWAEPEGVWGKCFLDMGDMSAVAENPGGFRPDIGELRVDGVIAFGDYWSSAARWQYVVDCARLLEECLVVTIWAYCDRARRYVPRTVEVDGLVEALRDSGLKKRILAGTGRVVHISDLRAMRALREGRL